MMLRTTITLDEDVRAKLEEQMRKDGRSFKEAVNHFLRLGLNAPSQLQPADRFVVQPRPLGLPAGLSYDNVEELLDQLEGPLRR